MDTQIQHIPLFPLNIFLLPGEQLPLHIFEPRYRQLFDEAENEGIEFGLPFEDDEQEGHFVSICTLLRVTKRYESGESDVIIEAKRVASLKEFESVFEGKLYPGGMVAPVTTDTLDERPSDDLMGEFQRYIELRYGTKPLISNLKNYRLGDLAASTALSNSDKVKLLNFRDTARQDRYLLQSIQYLNLLLDQERSFENGFILN